MRLTSSHPAADLAPPEPGAIAARSKGLIPNAAGQERPIRLAPLPDFEAETVEAAELAEVATKGWRRL